MRCAQGPHFKKVKGYPEKPTTIGEMVRRRRLDLNLRQVEAAKIIGCNVMTVVNWGSYSWSHPEWFGADGIHFTSAGAVQFGIYLHRTLRKYGLTGPIGSTSG